MYLVICSLNSSLYAMRFGLGYKPYPENELNNLEELVDELLKLPSSTADMKKMQQLKDAIVQAKSLIGQTKKKNRDKKLQKRIDDALKKVNKFYDKS